MLNNGQWTLSPITEKKYLTIVSIEQKLTNKHNCAQYGELQKGLLFNNSEYSTIIDNQEQLCTIVHNCRQSQTMDDKK